MCYKDEQEKRGSTSQPNGNSIPNGEGGTLSQRQYATNTANSNVNSAELTANNQTRSMAMNKHSTNISSPVHQQLKDNRSCATTPAQSVHQQTNWPINNQVPNMTNPISFLGQKVDGLERVVSHLLQLQMVLKPAYCPQPMTQIQPLI